MYGFNLYKPKATNTKHSEGHINEIIETKVI